MNQKQSPKMPRGVRELASGRYQARLTTPDGKRTLAPVTFVTKRDASAWISQQEADISRGLWKASAHRSSVTISFGDYAERWIERRKVKGRELSPRTVALYRDILARFVLPTFGNSSLHHIERDQVDDWYDQTAKDRPTRRAQAYSLLRAILNTAVDDGYLPANPCHIRGAGAVERRHIIEPASLEELVTITEAMPPRLQLLVQFAAWCGLRYGELIELRRDDLDLKKGMIRVRRSAVLVNHPRTTDRPAWSEVIVKDPKSNAGKRNVTIPSDLMGMVRAHLLAHTGPGENGLLFPSVEDPAKHMKPSTLAKNYFKARAVAGRPDLRFHDLRHTAAFLAAQSGASLATIMRRLGHSTSAAAMRYQHAVDTEDVSVAAFLSNARAAQRAAAPAE